MNEKEYILPAILYHTATVTIGKLGILTAQIIPFVSHTPTQLCLLVV